MKTFKAFLLGVLVFSLTFTMPVYASEVDILVDKLVEKGLLTDLEGDMILAETRREARRQDAYSAASSSSASSALPKWVQKMKLKGDFRLRFQYERKDEDKECRTRGRIRYRLGIETDIVEQVKVGFGLASGSRNDPRSTNHTMENAFSSSDIGIDYAYVQYKPMDGIKMVGGKFKRKPYLWAPTDLLWDGDINPEGASFAMEHEITDDIKGFVNTGVWILDHEGKTDKTDPFMNYVQGGVKAEAGMFDMKLAGTYYMFNGVQGAQINQDAGDITNTVLPGTDNLKYDYDSVSGGLEFGFKNPFDLPVERVAFFGEYIYNDQAPSLNDGWAAGMKFGSKKVKKEGSWQLKYIYAYLGKDAWVDAFPDSDRYGGKTNVKGHEFALNYALKDNVILGVDYYLTDCIKGSKNHEQLVQADLLLKF